jgi:hypothetical protein
LRDLACTVTAFTLAHSLSLGAVALDVFSVRSTIVEPLIAASIVYVGVANLRRGGPRRAWPEAFGFGLLHGLGFAGLLANALGAEQARLIPLLGFNLGIEFGQLLAAALPIGAFLYWQKVRRSQNGGGQALPIGEKATSEIGLAPPGAARVCSLGIVLAGLFWLGARLLS